MEQSFALENMDDAELVSPGGPISFDSHFDLELSAKGKKSFDRSGRTDKYGLFTQHTAEEFDMKLYRVDSKDSSSPIDPNVERTWVAQHEHDDEVGSFAIEREGDVDMDLMNAWLSKLLRRKALIFLE